MKSYKLEPYSFDSQVDYRQNLNAQQLKVVSDAEGPCLVLAGAGSGKTRVLIYRLAFLLENAIPSENILLATFTNRAANEMINRSETLLKSSLNRLWAGTFHHLGNITLRKEAQVLGYSSNFTIVDKQDADDLLQDCLEDLGLYKKSKMFPKKNIIYNIYSLAASAQVPVDKAILKFAPHIEEYASEIKKILSHYKKKKLKANIMDFTDLLTQWLYLLQDPAICDKYSRRFRYILVDEYQDTNKLQFEIIKLLSSYHNNILVVGDDAQSIYSFRAADINNILDFPKVFKGTRIFKLEVNYRSQSPILDMANEIIRHNIRQFPKTLEPMKRGGDLPCIVETKDVYQQAKFIGQRVLELSRQDLDLKDIAVLFRSRFQALELEMELLKRNIPYIVRGGMRFFEQAHIKDILSYLKVLINKQDELSFKRAVCLHKGIGRSYAYKIWDGFSQDKNFLAIEKDLPKRAREGFSEFGKLFVKLKTTKEPSKALREIIDKYKDYCYVSFDNPDERILDLEELAKMASTYATINQFLLDLGSFDDFKGESRKGREESHQTLVLSTIHQAKGLEWDVVFLIGCSDYEFPHPKAMSENENIEEERRLFYVATTRTKEQLYITYPQTKYTFKNGAIVTRASRFIYELDRSVYEEMIIEESF